MKKTNLLAILATILFQLATTNLFAGDILDSLAKKKSYFYSAKQEINDMLSGKIPLDYERAIFIIEDAYWENQDDYSYYQSILDFHTENILRIIDAKINETTQNFKPTLLETEEQKQDKYEKALTNWAIFSYMTDTSLFVGSNKRFLHLPFNYATNDPLGTTNWKNTQVFSLLDAKNKKGNCFALVSLFKIFSERLSSEAHICTAPGHIYIRHADNKGIYYNVELASRAFPGTGSLETLTYTTDEGTKNGISLRELDLKQSVALCLVYLAKGFEHKFNSKDDAFILQCAELALKYDSLNLNAMLLKAEVQEQKIISKNKTIAQLQTDKQFKEYEKLIAHLYKLGYREMPLEMKNIIISALRKDNTPIIAQNHTPKPFKDIGVTDTRYATLSWGLFDEMHEEKPFEQYSRTVFDTKKKKINKFEKADILYNQYNFDPVVFAWNVDPMAAKYPFISPYVFVNNNPILYVDKDGREWVNPYSSQVANTQKALLDNPNDKSLKRELKNAQTNESKVNEYLKNLKTNDEALYNYIDKLQVTDKSGNTANVKVYVYASDASQGDKGQVAQTNRLPIDKDNPKTVEYNGNDIEAPMSSKNHKVGFDVTVYGNTSFGDERLANEAGDIMYYMEYNKDAVKEKSNADYFEEGGGGMDAYLNSPSGSYSNRVESKYQERKKSGEGKKEDSNPYPLEK